MNRRRSGLAAVAALAVCFALTPLAAGEPVPLSLFPASDPLVDTAALDGRGEFARLRLGAWRPHGLGGTSVSEAELRWRVRGLELGLGWEEQDWAVLRGRRLRAAILAGVPGRLRLGLAWSWEGIEGSPFADRGELLLAGGSPLGVVLSTGLDPSPARAGRVALRWLRGPWRLTAWRGLGDELAREEGVGVAWSESPWSVAVLAGDVPWRGVEIGYRPDAWGLLLRWRLHPQLGLSQGIALVIR